MANNKKLTDKFADVRDELNADSVADIKDNIDTEAKDDVNEKNEKVASVPAVITEEEKASNAEFRKLPFVEKCKRDPLIPVSLLLAFIAVIVAAIYFILPDAKTPSMGMELSDFVQRFNNGEVAASLLSSGTDIGFRTPPYVDPASKPSMLGDKEVVTASGTYADFFSGPSKYNIGAGMEGATRKSDNNIAYVRVWIDYSDMDDENDFSAVWLYFANSLNALYPEMSSFESMGIALNKMGNFDGDPRFYVRGDYAFRLVPVQKDGATYIVIDMAPKAALKESQIREVLEVTSSDAVTESVPDESVASDAAST